MSAEHLQRSSMRQYAVTVAKLAESVTLLAFLLSRVDIGGREATFSFYFTRIGLPMDSAILLSLVAAALTMLFSLTGAAVYVSRRH